VPRELEAVKRIRAEVTQEWRERHAHELRDLEARVEEASRHEETFRRDTSRLTRELEKARAEAEAQATEALRWRIELKRSHEAARLADEIRDELARSGYQVRDTAEGPVLVRTRA
jgi:cysteinyl-tRNA synthetase